MILQMEKLCVFGLRENRESLISELMRSRCIQMRPPDELESFEEVAALTRGSPVESYGLEQTLSRYGAALAAIQPFAKKRGMLEAKPRVLYESLEDAAMLDKAEVVCSKIEKITGDIAACRSARSKDQFLRASLTPWAENNLPLELAGTRWTSVLYFLLPPRADMVALAEAQREQSLACEMREISSDKEQLYLLAVCHKDDEAALWDLLKSEGATKMSFGELAGTVAENISRLDKRIEEAGERLAAFEASLKECGQEIFPLQYAYDVLSVRIEREKAGGFLRETSASFCFTAWVPTARKEEATAILNRHGCYFEFADPSEEEEPPILLKNGGLVAPYEAVVGMYSMPAYRGFDPNGFVSVTYLIIFGMMLGDAGFGLLLVLGGLWMLKKMDLAPGAKNLVKVITLGGVSTTVWGIIYGSFFGDVIPVVSRVFFGNEVNPFKPMLDPIGDAMLMMLICLGVGVIHLFVGMGIKAYMLIKSGHPWEALFDIGFWYMFEIGLMLLLVGIILGNPTASDIGKYMSIVGAVGILLTADRESKNPIMRIMNGAGALYGISGFLSDVLSYSRILALGLATGVIAQVFNIIGTLLGGGVLGAILFIPVFLIGSGLNLGINTLGSYVHTARLHYVEFFGKFYEGGGKVFAPLMAQTKYIVVTNKEES